MDKLLIVKLIIVNICHFSSDHEYCYLLETLVIKSK